MSLPDNALPELALAVILDIIIAAIVDGYLLAGGTFDDN